MAEKNQNRELLDIVHQEVVAGAVFVGVNDRAARDLARSVTERLKLRIGGCQTYVPSTDKIDRAAVIADFDGRNHGEVCTKHRISRATLYRYLKAAR